jgi:Ca2+-binding RTX toxin-like protein
LTGIENLTGGSGNDTLTGNNSANALVGGAGDDDIYGLGGNDTMTGGDGNDHLYGGDGNDSFVGDLGDDVIDGGIGTNTLDYSAQTSFLSVDMVNGLATGGTIGNDTFSNIQVVMGGSTDDRYYTSSGNDTINDTRGWNGATASVGNDTYTMAGYIDYGSMGGKIVVDFTAGTVEKDTNGDGVVDYTDTFSTNLRQVNGTSGADIFYGKTGQNTMSGNGGNDTFYGSTGNDSVSGGSGTDTLYYTSLSGSINANLVLGVVAKSIDASSDTISSLEKMYVGSGDDSFTIAGSGLASWNTIDAGAGNDTISVSSAALATGIDAAQFNSVFDNVETLDLRNATLGSGHTAFTFTAADVVGLTDSNNSLNVYKSSGGLALSFSNTGGYTVTDGTQGGTTSGNVTFTNGSTTAVLHLTVA